MRRFFYVPLLLFSGLLFFACEDDLSELEQANRDAACFQDEDRDVVEILTDVDGFAINPSVNNCNGSGFNEIYTLSKGENDVRQLFPCNLNEQFMTDIDSLPIVYSGYLFEVFQTESICAQ